MPLPSNTVLAEQATADARVEAVAFAIKDFQWRGSRPTPWPGDNQDYWIETARAAIAALTRATK